MEPMRRPAGDGRSEIVQVGSRVATFTPREVSDFFLMFGGFGAPSRASPRWAAPRASLTIRRLRAEMEKHIVYTIDVIRAEADPAHARR
jgi:hypothetical protein